jgi:hypothetical protein
VFGSKLTLATPIPDLNLACYGATPTNQDSNGFRRWVPIGVDCAAQARALPDRRQILRLSRHRSAGHQELHVSAAVSEAYVRLDLINVFNWNNYTHYIETSAPTVC